MRDILFISVDDYANVGAGFAASGRAVGMDCLSIAKFHHIFNYHLKNEIFQRSTPQVELQKLADQFRCVVMMHSLLAPIKKRSWQTWAVFHGGERYREKKKKQCIIFNRVVDITLIQTFDLLGFGGKNEKLIFPAIDTEYIKPVFSDINVIKEHGLVFRHCPSSEFKGSDPIRKIMKNLSTRCTYTSFFGEIVPWDANLQRMAECDVYIESLHGIGAWGVSVMEAAALGKIVVTEFKNRVEYENEFNCECPIIIANTESDLASQIEKLLSFSPNEVIQQQLKTRSWIENVHSYISTGIRLKEVLCL